MPWHPWLNYGGQIVGAPAAFSIQHYRSVDVFVRAADNQLWQRVFLDDWSVGSWVRPDAEHFPLGSSPAVASTGHDLQVYARGADGQLWRKVWIAGRGWLRWEPLGGQIIGEPAAFSIQAYRWMDVFARAADNQLWQRAWRVDHWLPWVRPDAEHFPLGSSPAVASTGHDLQVYARGADGQLWRKVWIAGRGWLRWEPLGGQIIGAPTAFSIASRRWMDIFVLAADRKLWQRAWRVDRWLPWIPVDEWAGMITSSPAVASRGHDLQVFARDFNGALARRLWLPDPPPAPRPVIPVLPPPRVREITIDFHLDADDIWEGTQTYRGSYPGGDLRVTGEIRAINVPSAGWPYEVWFWKPSSKDPKDSNSWIKVASGESLKGSDLQLLMSSDKKQISVLAIATLPAARRLRLTITFTETY